MKTYRKIKSTGHKLYVTEVDSTSVTNLISTTQSRTHYIHVVCVCVCVYTSVHCASPHHLMLYYQIWQNSSPKIHNGKDYLGITVDYPPNPQGLPLNSVDLSTFFKGFKHPSYPFTHFRIHNCFYLCLIVLLVLCCLYWMCGEMIHVRRFTSYGCSDILSKSYYAANFQDTKRNMQLWSWIN